MNWEDIRELMRALGLRQYQLAERLGVSEAVLSKAIRDDREGELRKQAVAILVRERDYRVMLWQPERGK